MTSLSDNQWKVAHTIAQQLVLNEADANELGKAVAYLRAFGDRPDAGTRFFKYLQTLANNGRMMAHSNQTPYYRKIISQVCNDSLRSYQDDPAAMQEILSWGFRLMRYYKNAVPIGEVEAIAAETAAEPIVSERQAEIAQIVESLDLKVGDKVAATITTLKEGKKSKKLTYNIQKTQQKLSHDEYNKSRDFAIGQTVTLEIVELKEDGSIKKVKLSD